MSKSEKIFPLSTTGGRIQHLCIEKGISRKELYHAILKCELPNKLTLFLL